LGRVTEILQGAADVPVADAVWQQIATPVRLRAELEASPIDLDAVEQLAFRLGAEAIEPLLDLLESATEQSARARALKLLISIGPAVAEPAANRLANAPWYMQRNILILLRELKAWPAGFSAVSYARHSDVRVRREAYKLLLDLPQYRGSAMSHGLEDSDDDIIRLILRAGLESCPPEAHRAIERFIADGRRTPELRSLAVRVLGRAGGPQVLPRLLELAGARRSLLGWRLGPKSPVVIAAVEALARHWGDDPKVASVLALARHHPDAEIRLAAQVRYA
jgi:HEAT repeat protein